MFINFSETKFFVHQGFCFRDHPISNSVHSMICFLWVSQSPSPLGISVLWTSRKNMRTGKIFLETKVIVINKKEASRASRYKAAKTEWGSLILTTFYSPLKFLRSVPGHYPRALRHSSQIRINDCTSFEISVFWRSTFVAALNSSPLQPRTVRTLKKIKDLLRNTLFSIHKRRQEPKSAKINLVYTISS